MKTILLGEILNQNTSLRKSLGPFTKVLYDVEKSIPFNLRYNFYNNLLTLKVQLNLDKTKILKNFYSFGIYDAKKNKIIIDSYAIKKFLKKNNINVIYFNEYINLFLYHELMHMASSKKDGNIYYSGFDKYPVNITELYSRSLTEGHTEYLACRYYNINNNFYYIDMKITNMLMCILGNDVIAYSYYNTLGIALLIQKLKEICPNEDIDKLFKNINYRYSERFNEDNVYFIPLIQNILVNIFIVKINNDSINGITYEELMPFINFFKDSLITYNGLKKNYPHFRNLPNLNESLIKFNMFYENIFNNINMHR